MKKKIIGLLIFMFFIFGYVIMEGGSIANLFVSSIALLVLGSASGLLLMYYKKGMDKNKLLRKAKQYFIFSGYFSVLISVIMILATVPVDELESVEYMVKVASAVLTGLLYGYAFAYVTDTFIEEE
ncbi:hypothetical protein [Clostridium tagluense]|uniref:hypothetical protein n=1 Tax=Clostridium tagluense TaxID=360422 RepID=UPI001C6E37B9|nr:hypothetical protein [Clostridium tagluense]MBW9155753.1 hypothetical protein [Clostridium tagluense]WLC65350.1 hypothetical protein KTC93_21465 [Clostridium tagluense]